MVAMQALNLRAGVRFTQREPIYAELVWSRATLSPDQRRKRHRVGEDR